MKVKNLNLANLVLWTYGYASVWVTLGSGILGFGFHLYKIETGKYRISFESGMVRFGFELSIFGLLRVGSLRIGFEFGQVISGVDHLSSCYNSGFVRLWIGLF